MAPKNRTSLLREVRRRPALLLWCCYLALIPFYIFPSGLPQPGDMLILLLVPVSLAGWKGRMPRKTLVIFRPLLWFTIWVIVVDVVWALLLQSFANNLFYPTYYIFNTTLFLAAAVLYQRFGMTFVYLTVNVVLGSVAFQCVASFFYRGVWGHSRGTLFFQNPNQLGYYALLAACIFAISYRVARHSLLRAGLSITACGYLALLSASRSAVGGVLMVAALMIFSNPRVLIIAALVTLALSVVGSPAENSFESLQERISENRQPGLSFFEQRGYDRIWNNKAYAVLGAGEGNNWRFADSTALGKAEIHSSIGTILFCYGIVGFLLLGAFLRRLIRRASMRYVLILFPAVSYTFAHQGARFSMVWVLFALFMVIKDNLARVPQAPRVPQPTPAASVAA